MGACLSAQVALQHRAERRGGPLTHAQGSVSPICIWGPGCLQCSCCPVDLPNAPLKQFSNTEVQTEERRLHDEEFKAAQRFGSGLLKGSSAGSLHSRSHAHSQSGPPALAVAESGGDERDIDLHHDIQTEMVGMYERDKPRAAAPGHRAGAASMDMSGRSTDSRKSKAVRRYSLPQRPRWDDKQYDPDESPSEATDPEDGTAPGDAAAQRSPVANRPSMRRSASLKRVRTDAVVVKVMSGVDFVVSLGTAEQPVRLRGLSAPKDVLRDESRNELGRLINTKTVLLDVWKSRRGVWIADVKSKTTKDDIGVEMLRAGLVRVRRSELRTRYRELLADAQKRKVGLWDSAAKL